jgi:hypothetical protein
VQGAGARDRFRPQNRRKNRGKSLLREPGYSAAAMIAGDRCDGLW